MEAIGANNYTFETVAKTVKENEENEIKTVICSPVERFSGKIMISQLIDVELEEDKGPKAPTSCKARMESFRLKLKNKLVGQSPSISTGAKSLTRISSHIELLMKSRVADAELEEFADYAGEFGTKYELKETIGEVYQ